ncbi:MAG: FmdB family zinc ribbon protein [Phycisphaerales bacterium]
MPTYDYRCKACKHEFEHFQSMLAKPIRTCPECGKKTLERLIGTGAALLFKGSGFYQTDYRSDAYQKSADADRKGAEPKADAKPDTKADSTSDAKGDAKSDSKPETKGDSKSESRAGDSARKAAAKPDNAPPKKCASRSAAKRAKR